MNNSDEINYYFKNNCQNKIGMFVTRIKSLHDMEELKRVQKLRIDEKRLMENQDTINDLMAKIQEQQIEITCMNDTRIFLQMLNESAQSGL